MNALEKYEKWVAFTKEMNLLDSIALQKSLIEIIDNYLEFDFNNSIITTEEINAITEASYKKNIPVVYDFLMTELADENQDFNSLNREIELGKYNYGLRETINLYKEELEIGD